MFSVAPRFLLFAWHMVVPAHDVLGQLLGLQAMGVGTPRSTTKAFQDAFKKGKIVSK